MLPNCSRLRVGSRRRPQRGRLVRKPTEPTEGKIPALLMGTIEERQLWYDADGKLPDALKSDKPAERAFWWFSNNPDDPDTQDVVTFDSLAEGYEPNDQWNAHFWFWTGETKKILVPLPLPQGTMPNPEEWVDAHSVIDVPKDWREPGPKALIQVAPTRPGMPGEFVHKGALLLQFAMQRRNEPWGVWVKNVYGTETLVEYPYAYRGPGGTGRDLFIPRKDGPQGQHFDEMEKILLNFLAECYKHDVLVDGKKVEGVRLYDFNGDAKYEKHFGRDKQTNPFPTPWKWGGGTRPSHYDGTGWEVALQVGYARSSYGDNDLYQNENPWGDESDDEADNQYEYGSGGEDQEEEEEESEGEDEDMENPAEQARQDIQELAVLARESATRTFATFMFESTSGMRLVEKLEVMISRLDDPIYTDMIADGFHDDLWEDFKDAVLHMYRLFGRVFYWPDNGIPFPWQEDMVRYFMERAILGFLHAASVDQSMANWIRFVVEPKLEALRLWRATHLPEDIDMHTVVTQLLEYIGISETQFAAEPMWQFQSKADIYNFDAAVKDWMRGNRLEVEWNMVRASMITIDNNTSNSHRNDPSELYINNLHSDDTFRGALATLCAEVFSSGNARTANNRRRAPSTINFLTSVLVQTPDRGSLIPFLTNGSTLLDDLRAHMDYLTSPAAIQDLTEQQRSRQIRSTDYLIKLLLNEDEREDEEPTPEPAPSPMVRRRSSEGYQTRSRTRQRTGAALRRPGLLPRFFS